MVFEPVRRIDADRRQECDVCDPRRWLCALSEEQFRILVGRPNERCLEARRFNYRPGKSAQDRYPQLAGDYAGGAGRIVGCSHCSLYTSVEIGDLRIESEYPISGW